MTEAAAGTFRTRIEWVDTDASGIYHNSTVIRFVEAAEARLMLARGVVGFTPTAPRARYEVDFEAPLVFGQDVETTVRVHEVGTTSMTFTFEVWGEEFHGRPRRRAATGRYVAVHIGTEHDPATPRAVAWPEPWVAALTAQCPS